MNPKLEEIDEMIKRIKEFDGYSPTDTDLDWFIDDDDIYIDDEEEDD